MQTHRTLFKLATLSIALILLLGSFGPALAQQSITRLQIASIDSVTFPDVKLRAIVRDSNGNMVPVADLQSNLELAEKVMANQEVVSDEAHGFALQQVDVGVEVIFLLDVGADADDVGATGKTRIEEMKEVVQSYLGLMTIGDTAGLWVVSGSGVSTIQPITSDSNLILSGLGKLPGGGSRSDGVAGLTNALQELVLSANHNTMVQSIVLISTGLYNGDEGVQDVINLAKSNNVTINTVLVRDYAYTNAVGPLSQLAAGTMGTYVHYKTTAAPQLIFTWLANQRQQIEMSFRSAFGDSSERTLELRTKGQGVGQIATSATYQVTLLPPVVIINDPASNTEITRQAPNHNSNMDEVQPTIQQISIQAIWPDGFKRSITQAQFLLDGISTGAPLLYPGDSFNFTWGLKEYRTAGTDTHQLQISVMDELGLSTSSEPVTVKVTVIIPAVPAIVGDYKVECAGKEGFEMFKCQVTTQVRAMFATPSGWISLGSLVVALAAVVVAVRYRGRIVEAGQAAVDVIRTTINAFTRPAGMEAGAFLEVLRGDEDLKGKFVPVYNGTVTPVGRSPQEAELVFDQHNERSVVSRRHCEFRGEDGDFKIRDLGSTHGTFVNGIRLPEGGEGQSLTDGDKIELGPAERGGILLVFRTSDTPRNTQDYDEDTYKTNPAYSND